MHSRSLRLARAVPSVLAALLLLSADGPASAALRQAARAHQRAPGPLRAQVYDGERRLDVNRINLATTNFGSFAFDYASQDAGLVWPRGSGLHSVFASGLWLGGMVNGNVRVALAEYSQEYVPGVMEGGVPVNPDDPNQRVYKMARWTGNPADSEHVDRLPAELAADPDLDPLLHHSWAEYRMGAAPHGAPMRTYRLPVTATPDPADSVDVAGPDVLGDVMLWCTYNDADPNGHTNDGGGTLPLGVQVQQTLFAFDRPDDLGDVVFLRMVLLNLGGNVIQDFHVSLWTDPDLGGALGFTDDLVGCDTLRSLGYTYNATNNDGGYGTPPPALGFTLLRGPAFPSGGAPLGMTAFARYINGADPISALQSFNYMRGLAPDGSTVFDPLTGLPAVKWVPGDPVSGTGWLDNAPADKRFLMTSGPGVFGPGETKEIWAAIMMGRGNERLASVATVQSVTDLARAAFEQGFPASFPTQDVRCSTSTALSLANCPRPAEYWGDECAAGGTGELTLAQLQAVAASVNARSNYFAWNQASPLSSFCATVAPFAPPDLRQQAQREFATFLANYAGNDVPLPVTPPDRIFLFAGTPVSCPPLTATTFQELAATGQLVPGFIDARYLNNITTNRRALDGVSSGLPFFNGGAGEGADFLGSSLNTTDHPDSFKTVEIRFNTGAPQKVHRLLKYEKLDGSVPALTGPAYAYGGFFDCYFQVWDVANDVQLDAIFVERYPVLDDAGTPSPDSTSIIPTLDRVWAPTDEPTGGHEYLLVLNRPYTGFPLDEVRVPGALLDAQLPVLYSLVSRRRTIADVIDDGDAFLFEWARRPSPGVDQLMYDLEQLPLEDPNVQQQYQQILDCLSAINSGVGIGPVCASTPTAALVSLVEAHAERDRVTLRWYSDAIASATVERRAEGGEWRALGRISPDGTRQLVFVDRDVVAGAWYDYRLAVHMQDGVRYFGEARVEIALESRLALLGSRFDQVDGRVVVRFSLAARAPARLEVLDIAGRRMLARDLSGLEPGEHVLTLDESARLPSGIYLLRIEQTGKQAKGKVAVIR